MNIIHKWWLLKKAVRELKKQIYLTEIDVAFWQDLSIKEAGNKAVESALQQTRGKATLALSKLAHVQKEIKKLWVS